MSDTYSAVAAVAADLDLRLRIAACAAQQGETNPEHWAYVNALKLAASPGWGAAYALALAKGVERPGADEAVITDGQILAAVQALLGPPTEEGSDGE